MTQLLLTLALSIAWLRAACVTVDGDNILIRDLAVAAPEFASAEPGQVVGFAPQPGSIRVLRPQELARLAARSGISGRAFQPVCFERLTVPLTAERLLPALKKALNLPTAEISILDFSRYRLAPGELDFSLRGLSPPPPSNSSAGVIWRGHLIGKDGRRVPIWAKVKITAELQWVEAACELPVGRPLSTSQLVLRTGRGFPLPKPVATIEDAAGRRPVRPIRAGQTLLPTMLEQPHDVAGGDPVLVEVSSGGAALRFEARAESSGREGETIAVRNPVSGRRFLAVVQAKGKVLVNANLATGISELRPHGSLNHGVGERSEPVR